MPCGFLIAGFFERQAGGAEHDFQRGQRSGIMPAGLLLDVARSGGPEKSEFGFAFDDRAGPCIAVGQIGFRIRPRPGPCAWRHRADGRPAKPSPRRNGVVSQAHRAAVWASIDSPLVIISTALPKPTIRDARAVPPQPGNSPSLTSGKPNCVFSSTVMIRRSHQMASSAPPPTQMPSIAATVTQLIFDNRAKSCWPAMAHLDDLLALGTSNEAANSRRSAPAMNEPGLPERMIRPARSVRFSSWLEQAVQLRQHAAR